MSLFVNVPVRSVSLEQPLQYSATSFSSAELRKAENDPALKERLRHQCTALKLNPHFIDVLNVEDYIAKTCNIGRSQGEQWIFTGILVIFLYEFDDHFDQPQCSPENITRLSAEMRALFVTLSRHGLGGLQGEMEDWPAAVPCREAYVWLLKKAENLREGAGHLTLYTFFDYCLGVLLEIVEWGSDVYQQKTSAWNLARYNEVRKRSAGLTFAIAPPLFVANEWMKQQHFTKCNDLLYDAAIVVGLANDILGLKKDTKKESGSIGMKFHTISSLNEVVSVHNEKVEFLKGAILEMDGDTKRFMEEIEISVAGMFCWQCNSRRYNY